MRTKEEINKDNETAIKNTFIRPGEALLLEVLLDIREILQELHLMKLATKAGL